jgi:predicted nucleic acid-binding protein
MLVVDASMVVAGLVDRDRDGAWARQLMKTEPLAAPQLLHVEVSSALRSLVLRRVVSEDVATLAHRQMLDLRVDLFPYAAICARVWALRGNATPYDACYVALAESLDTDVATLDRRLTRVKGLRCGFRTP